MGKPLIMVVEDDLDLLEIMKMKLESSGYSVMEAVNGEDALRFVKRNKPDLILLDIMIPGKDGYEVCKSIKSNNKLRDIPVIMVTAKALSDDEKRGILSGADDYVTKPFGFTDLFERIKRFAPAT